MDRKGRLFAALVLVVVVVGFAGVSGVAAQTAPGGEQTSQFRVDAGTSTGPIEVGKSPRVCATADMGSDRIGWSFNNTPMEITSAGTPTDTQFEPVDGEDCVSLWSCEVGADSGVSGVILNRSCGREESGNIFEPTSAGWSWEGVDDCRCLNVTGKVTVFYETAGGVGEQERAWMNFTVLEIQEVSDAWRVEGTQAEGGSENRTVAFEAGSVPFFSNLDTFAVPGFWFLGAMILLLNGWLLSGTFFVVGYMGQFTSAGWASNDLLLGLAGLFIIAEVAANMPEKIRKRLPEWLGGRENRRGA